MTATQIIRLGLDQTRSLSTQINRFLVSPKSSFRAALLIMKMERGIFEKVVKRKLN